MTLSPGMPLPAFTLPTDGTRPLSDGDLRGAPLVLYFYPRDNTPGCTREAEGFRDHMADFAALNTRIVGVSRDSEKKHANFIAKLGLPFPLLADEDGTLCEAFGVWKEKTNYGKTTMGIERATFLFDAEGVLRQEWRKVKVAGHVEAVLAAVKAL